MISDRELEKYGESFLQAFEAIRRALALYPPNHPNVADQLNRFLRNLHELRGKVGDATFNVVNREFFVNGVPLKRISITYEKNLAAWEQLGLGLVRFEADATTESILRFFEVIVKVGAAGADPVSGGVAQALEAAGVRGIRATRVSAGTATDDSVMVQVAPVAGVAPTDPAEARARYRDSASELGAIIEAVCESAGSASRMVHTFTHALERRLLARRPVRSAIDRLVAHDPDAGRHAVSGALVAVAMGGILGLSRDRLLLLGEAAVLRDVGKLELSPEVLRARSDDEAAVKEYRRHPALGARALLLLPELDPSAAIVALEHHAGHDGKGFPKLRSRHGLHPFTRIVSVASDYDRATGGYHGVARVPPVAAVLVLARDAGSRYDPGALRALLRLLGLYPEGTAVTLADRSYGVVAGPGTRTWIAPEVVRLRDAQGHDVEPEIVATDGLQGNAGAVVLGIGEPTALDTQRLERLRFAL